MNISLFHSSLLICSLGWTLLHFLWQGSLIAVLLRAALAFVSRSQANVRYLLCYGALLLCAFGAAATFAYLTETSSNFSGKELGSVISLSPPSFSKLDVLNVRWGSLINPWLIWIVLSWLIGALAGFLRFGLALAHVRSLARGARGLDDVYWEASIKKLSHQLGVNQAVRVVSSVATNVPLVIGLLKPTILLPISLLTQLSTEQIECILAHELAHIRRHDYLANICQVIIESILFYHPAVWWIGREIRREREYCCDDLALSTHSDVVFYAKALATLEQSRAASLDNSLTLAASDGALMQRIRRILNPSKLGGQNTKTSRAMYLATLTPGTIFLVLVPILMLFLTIFNNPTFAQTSVPTKPNSNIWITADGLNTYQGDVATADNNATCHFQDYELTADHLTYNRSTKTIQGTGHAKLRCPDGKMVLGFEIIVPDCQTKPLKHFFVVSRPRT